MKARLVILLLAVTFSCGIVTVRAQDKGSGAASHQRKSQTTVKSQSPLPPLLPEDGGAAPQSESVPSANPSPAHADYNDAYWKYQRGSLDHLRKIYAWQYLSSIVIFFVVIFLVLMGVLFSWLQFKAAAYKGESEELDASMQGVKITSSTLGVVILVLSMCFFYLYLRYVYPINMNEGTKLVVSSEKEAGH